MSHHFPLKSSSIFLLFQHVPRIYRITEQFMQNARFVLVSVSQTIFCTCNSFKKLILIYWLFSRSFLRSNISFILNKVTKTHFFLSKHSTSIIFLTSCQPYSCLTSSYPLVLKLTFIYLQLHLRVIFPNWTFRLPPENFQKTLTFGQLSGGMKIEFSQEIRQ